MVDNLIDINL